MHVEINGTARCAANDVDTLESVNQHHDCRSQHDAHTRSFTCEEQGKKNSDRTDNRESRTPTSWKILVLDQQSTTIGERSPPRQPQDRGPFTSCKPKQSRTMTDNNSTSERGEHTTNNHIDFCAMGCVHFQLSSPLVDQPTTTTVTRPCFAATNQHQTENSALVLTIGSKWRRFHQQMSNAVSVPFLNEVMMFITRYSQSLHHRDSSQNFRKTHVVVESGGDLGKDTFTLVRFDNKAPVDKRLDWQRWKRSEVPRPCRRPSCHRGKKAQDAV